MTSAIGSTFGATFTAPGAAPPRAGTQPEALNEDVRRNAQIQPADNRRDAPPPFEANSVRGADAAEETTRPTFTAASPEPTTFQQPSEQQVEQARGAGQTRGSFLDIRA